MPYFYGITPELKPGASLIPTSGPILNPEGDNIKQKIYQSPFNK